MDQNFKHIYSIFLATMKLCFSFLEIHSLIRSKNPWSLTPIKYKQLNSFIYFLEKKI